MKIGFVLSFVLHVCVLIFVLAPAKAVEPATPKRFMKASLVRKPRLDVEVKEKTKKPPEKSKPKAKPKRFKRPDKKKVKDAHVVNPKPVLQENTRKPLPEKRRQQTPAERKTPIMVEEKEFTSNYYLGLMRDKVYRNWQVSERPFTLRCILYFQVNRSGKVIRLRLERSSGFYDFDRAAMRAIENASPFPPLPPSYKKERLTIHFAFENL